ncbi:MAG: hypothetical protein KJ072_25240 [Verrucomicrobia bacterium]|nr:hypothetical protein [Verrucomicrobiota bacterium]
MTELEDLMKAAMAASVAKREEALRLLKGQLPKPEPYLTLRELSRALGFGVTTLRRWKIPGHDLGGFQRYHRSEVEAYLRSDDFKRRQAALRAERRISAKAAAWRLKPQTPTRKENHALLQRPNHHRQPSSLSSRV